MIGRLLAAARGTRRDKSKPGKTTQPVVVQVVNVDPGRATYRPRTPGRLRGRGGF